MIKVTSEINPCHNPIQNPAGSSVVNFSFPGAQELTKKRTKISKGTHLKSVDFLIMVLVFGKYRNFLENKRKTQVIFFR